MAAVVVLVSAAAHVFPVRMVAALRVATEAVVMVLVVTP